MRNLIILVLTAAFTTMGFAQDNCSKTGNIHDLMDTKTEYTCAMHPNVMEDQQGKCPSCGMELVTAEKGTKTTIHKEHELSNEERVCICWKDESMTKGKCSKCGAKMEEMK
jgi:transcription initiation factor IIE alpha subunit